VSPLLDEPIRSVVLVRARTGLGDLLCTAPALRALRARLPRAHVALLTYAEMRPVVERLPGVDELLELPGWPGIPERPVDEAALAPFLERVRARRFGLAVQMYGANAAANELTEALGAARTAGFFVPGTIPRPDLTRFLPYPHSRHEVRRHLDLLALLGAPPAGEELAFPIGRDDEEAAEAALRAAGLEGRPYALLHPGATSPSRRWPFARWAAVGDALAARGLAVGITGVRGEEPAVAAVRERMRAPAADLCGRTRLGAFAALVRGAELLVGNDSGPAHMAAAVGTPSVTVFLSGDPVRWAHPGPHRIARVQVECNPCPHLSCPIDHRCAQRLTAADVLAQVDALPVRAMAA
jgi:ADP-heptose:LPS heptosyltransferase